MDDQRTPQIAAARTEQPSERPSPEQDPTPAPAKAKGRRKRKAKKQAQAPAYAFAAEGRRCPRCHGWDTIAVSTQANVQYRQCRAPVCRRRYTVLGRALEDGKGK